MPISEFETMSPETLKERFEEAQKQGSDYLVKVSYVFAPLPVTVPGLPVAINNVQIYEDTYGVSKDTLAADLVDIYKRRDALNIISVYDLSQGFNACAKGGVEMLPDTEYKAAQEHITQIKQEHEAAMKARPLWKKLLGLAP